jgi:threonine aldolase
MKIDLRSDTFTVPTKEMLEVMRQAPVGDDVFGEDSSVNDLENYAATLFGMEAGLFCPSGTMTNQIAIKCHTQPMDEVLCDKTAHIYMYEGGGIAFNSSASVRLLDGKNGIITPAMVEENINADNVHYPKTSLLSLENTSNRGGGTYYTLAQIAELKAVAQKHGLKFHVDGARVFNALTETKENPAEYGKYFDSISICLSKGLGAPVGSVLLGSTAMIKQARRIRKVLGG